MLFVYILWVALITHVICEKRFCQFWEIDFQNFKVKQANGEAEKDTVMYTQLRRQHQNKTKFIKQCNSL